MQKGMYCEVRTKVKKDTSNLPSLYLHYGFCVLNTELF